MNTTKIISAINSNNELLKDLKKVSHYDTERFISDAIRYIKAIKERRMICNIDKVSSSGMSRNIKFVSCEQNKARKEYYYSNYFAFFKAMGYTVVKDSDTFRIGGCGMDMIFHTNYTIIHRLCRLGFISKKECERLCQMTPNVI